MQTQNHAFQLGDQTYQLRQFSRPGNSIFLTRLHGNEIEASIVGQWWIEQYGGTFLDVVNTTREFKFYHQNKEILFDPNRIFSQPGILQTLRDYESTPDTEIIQTIQHLSDLLSSFYSQQSCITALHNNENFNIHYYLADDGYIHSAQDVYINPNENPHNFVIVTVMEDFLILKKQGVNSVLEKMSATSDSGSLSEYCIQNNIRYFNIETHFGQLAKQKELLSLVATAIPTVSPF